MRYVIMRFVFVVVGGVQFVVSILRNVCMQLGKTLI